MATSIITESAMKGTPKPAGTWLAEPAGRGEGRLVGRITPSGERLFYFRYTKSSGERDTLIIGTFHTDAAKTGTFTVAQARAQAGQWRELLGNARTPGVIGDRDLRRYLADRATETQAERVRLKREQDGIEAKRIEEETEARRRAVTLRQVFDQWRTTDLQPRYLANGKRVGRKDGGQYVFEQFERHVFPELGSVAIENVASRDVWKILDVQKAAGKLRTANVLLAELKQLFAFAVDREILESNPTTRIKKDKVGGSDVARERFLSVEEIALLATRLPEAKLSRRSELAIWIILATGCRIGELMGATWSDHQSDAKELKEFVRLSTVKYGTVNLRTREWHIYDTKNQRDHPIHLSDMALQKFKELLELKEHGDWIFPDTSGKKHVCVKSFGKQLADRQRDGKPMKNRSTAMGALALLSGRWTAHDLRRTAGTLMAILGTSGDVINECLNHKQTDKMKALYIQSRREPEQAIAFDKLSLKLTELATGEPQSNVIAGRFGKAAA